MMYRHGAGLALIALMGCALAFPAFAQDTNTATTRQTAIAQDTTGQTTPGQPTTGRQRRRRRTETNTTTQTQPMENTAPMSPSAAEDVAANDAVFATFQQHLDKANDTLNRLSQLLDQIVNRNAQAQPAPSGGGQ